MRPTVSVLQLDTHFPRIPGDVGSKASYLGPIEIIRIPQATVRAIVSDRPDQINIVPFEGALRIARGDVIVTSCGFLSYWQVHLQRSTRRPFISSALMALEGLAARYRPDEILIVTFDAAQLTPMHLGATPDYKASVVGLPQDSHLRKVIEGNLGVLDRKKAQAEVVALVTRHVTPAHKHILFECTNLPPYATAVEAATGLPVTDILSLIEQVRPGTVENRRKVQAAPGAA